MPVLRQAVLKTLLWMRQTPLRRPALILLVKVHNASYHLIALFSSHTGKHPKHDIQKYHEFFLKHINRSDHVLDVGSGTGYVAWQLADKAKQVVGIEIAEAKVIKAQHLYRHPNLSFIVGDATTHTFTQAFDVIVLSNTLEHIDDRVTIMKALANLAPKILIRVPMLTRDWITVHKKQLGLPYLLDETHTIEYEYDSFRREMAAANLSIQSLHVNFGEIYAVITTKKQPTAVTPQTHVLAHPQHNSS